MDHSFYSLPYESPEKTKTTSLLNRKKNRYDNILVYDDNRIVLRNSADPPRGFGPLDVRDRLNHYINASPIDDQYICSQAPLPNEFSNFWKMIWQEKIDTIVMLTKLIEKKTIKAHKYWPDINQTITFDKISVTCIKVCSCSKVNDYYVRTFLLKKNNEESRIVTQYKYFGWSDHSVPANITGIKNMYHMLCSIKGKMLIHCSAGIGRSGVLVSALIHHKNKKSIHSIVKHIRTKRPGMVQTEEQYNFIFKLI